jgi:hypothetical protein
VCARLGAKRVLRVKFRNRFAPTEVGCPRGNQRLAHNNPMRGGLVYDLIQEPKLRRVAALQPPPERCETFLAENRDRRTVVEASCVRVERLGLGRVRVAATGNLVVYREWPMAEEVSRLSYRIMRSTRPR